MNKQVWLWLLPLLLLSACMPNLDYGQQSVYTHGLVHVDSLGQIEFLPEPAVSRTKLSVERLPDGRILMIGNSLHIYNPDTQELTDITPSGHYSYFSPPAHDLSPDGIWLYHQNLGSIRRLNLQNFSSEVLAVGSDTTFVRPVISRDGRYLTYLHSNQNIYATTHNGGYPIVMDMLTGTYTCLNSADHSWDDAITHAWKAMSGDLVYFIADTGLMVMDLQGGNRILIRDQVCSAQESFDGRFLLCLDSYFLGLQLSYRDNQTMTWNTLSETGQHKLCRGANIVYTGSDGSLFKTELATGELSTVFTSSLQGRKITRIDAIAPSWDGKDVVAWVTYKEWVNSKYPL
ncbi:MAG TPA: hypothetical protein PLX59_05385 [Candidatus Cloacimonadota bacterium]|nr:hypothetical protein [Candidatus Cloacimonadota bacterium]